MRDHSRILVANTEEAKLFSFKVKEGFQLVNQFDNQLFENEIKCTDAPGRNFQRNGYGSSSLDKEQGQKEDLRHHFIHYVCDSLSKDWEISHFKNLYLIAENKALGDLRRFLSKQLKELVALETPMNLVNLEEQKIIQHLKELENK